MTEWVGRAPSHQDLRPSGTFQIHFPIVTSIVLSLVLTLIMRLFF